MKQLLEKLQQHPKTWGRFGEYALINGRWFGTELFSDLNEHH